jgi:hypothetical protein
MAQWLNIVSWIAVILGLLTALVIAFDVTAHPQHMKIMNVVWPIGTDYFDIALPENVADVSLGLIFHTLSLYVPCNALSAAYPLFWGMYFTQCNTQRIIL